MKPRATVWIFCLVVSAGCLAGGYALAGQPAGAATALLPAALWIAAVRKRKEGLASAGLAGYLGLAAGGMLLGASAQAMLIGATLALAGWDLTAFAAQLPPGEPDRATERLEAQHLRALLPAVALGLALVEAGLLVHVRAPFGVLLVLALVALVGLGRVQRYLGR